MKMTQLFTKTSKTVPADETSKNAKLLIQAGYIHKEMAGVYDYLPFGLRVLEKVKQIVREEMNEVGGQELIMSNLQRPELWMETTRWDDDVVDIWFKTKLKDQTEIGLAWSHEEPIMDMMQHFVQSYKDLPTAAYQFQTKLRNELRAKSGVMRGREFVMKDMYSLHVSAEDLDAYYNKVIEAYKRVYERLGIGADTYVTYASGGAFTKFSHEFQTICDAGEDIIVKLGDGTWHNLEIVPAKIPVVNSNDEQLPFEEKELKNVIGVQALLKALNIPIEKSTKTLIYTAVSGETIFAVIRSDYDINLVKLAAVSGLQGLHFASDDEVKKITGAETGYAGIVNLPENSRVFYDDSLEGITNFETGANKTHFHAINVNFDRDVPKPDKFYDFKEARQGDLDPETGKPLEFVKTAEVGNVFNFGTDKSNAMGIYFTGNDGEQRPIYLASYGIGVTRVMGVIVEKFADDKGIVWPEALAPYKVYLARLGADDDITKAADEAYKRLTDAGIEVLYDERDVRPGEKFADADLLGIPYRLVLSAKTLAEGKCELKRRTETDTSLLTIDEVTKKIAVNNGTLI